MCVSICDLLSENLFWLRSTCVYIDWQYTGRWGITTFNKNVTPLINFRPAIEQINVQFCMQLTKVTAFRLSTNISYLHQYIIFIKHTINIEHVYKTLSTWQAAKLKSMSGYPRLYNYVSLYLSGGVYSLEHLSCF